MSSDTRVGSAYLVPYWSKTCGAFVKPLTKAGYPLTRCHRRVKVKGQRCWQHKGMPG